MSTRVKKSDLPLQVEEKNPNYPTTYRFDGNHYDPQNFIDCSAKAIFSSLRNALINKEDSYDIVDIYDTTEKSSLVSYTHDVRVGHLPTIHFNLLVHLPAERNRFTEMKINGTGNKVPTEFSLPFPHRYMQMSFDFYFRHNRCQLEVGIEKIFYAFKAVHRIKNDFQNKIKPYLIGTWMPNHDYHYYCGNKDWKISLMTFSALYSQTLVADTIAKILQHFYNSAYNQDLSPYGFGTPAASYIFKHLDVCAEFEKLMTIVGRQISMLYVSQYQKSKKDPSVPLSSNCYFGSEETLYLPIAMAMALQKKQNFWETLEYDSRFNIDNWHTSYGNVFKTKPPSRAALNSSLQARIQEIGSKLQHV